MKRYLFPSIALLLLVAASVAACSGGPTSTVPIDRPTAASTQSDEKSEATSTSSTEPETENATITPPPTRQAQEPAKTATPEPEATDVALSAEAEQVVCLAKEDLANRLDLAAHAIHLVAVQTVDWPDASLGCPEPGMMYAQVITPGFRVVLEAQRQGMYEYHTDRDDRVILCQPEAASQEPPTKGITDSTPWQPVEPIEPDSLSPTPRQ
jgi:hypothetical protein